MLGEMSGFEIDGEHQLMTLMSELAQMKAQYDKVSFALHEVMEKGYGIVSPSTEELTLDEPKIVKQGGRFGVKLKASAPSIHMIRADIETEVLKNSRKNLCIICCRNLKQIRQKFGSRIYSVSRFMSL